MNENTQMLFPCAVPKPRLSNPLSSWVWDAQDLVSHVGNAPEQSGQPLTHEPALSFPGTTDTLGLNHIFLLSQL